MVKNLPANAGDAGDTGSIPESGSSPGGRNGNPLQDSCLQNPMDRGAWRAIAHGVKKELDMTKQQNSNNVYVCVCVCVCVTESLCYIPETNTTL